MLVIEMEPKQPRARAIVCDDCEGRRILKKQEC